MQLAETNASTKRAARRPALEPLTVPHRQAQHVIGVGKTKYWELVKDGHVEVVKIGRRSMARYSSLKRLAGIVE